MRKYEDVPRLKNLGELLDFTAESFGDTICYRWSDGEVSFKEFREIARTLGGYFAATYPRVRAAIIGENSVEYLLLFFGIILGGGTAILIDKEETPEKITEMLKIAEVTDVFMSDKKHIEISGAVVHKFAEIFELDLRDKGELPPEDAEREACIFFTSGTTGKSKAVQLSVDNILACLYGASSLYRPHGGTVEFLPFHHAFGFVAATLMPYYYGVETYLTSSLKTVAHDIKTNSPETLFAVPAVMELFHKQIWRSARSAKKDRGLDIGLKIARFLPKFLRRKLFSSVLAEFGERLNVIICGGAYLDEKYIEFFRRLGVTVLNGFGITECAPVVSVNRVRETRAGSVGQICRDVKVRIAEDEEVLIAGPTVMKGYFRNAAATREALRKDGDVIWFHTGDLGYVDDDGFLFITGRKKNLIILSNGENISPEEIETEFLHEEAVRECMVSVENEQMVIEIFPSEERVGDEEFFEKMLYNYNKSRSRNHQIASFKLRDVEFPKNNNTKILRKE